MFFIWPIISLILIGTGISTLEEAYLGWGLITVGLLTLFIWIFYYSRRMRKKNESCLGLNCIDCTPLNGIEDILDCGDCNCDCSP